MPNWKKLIVSGSAANLSSLTIDNNTTGDSLLLTTTENSSTAAPVITLKRNSDSPASSDYLGQIKFKGENDADQEVVYAKITGKIQDNTDGTEDGLIEIANRKAGSNNIGVRIKSDKVQLLNGTTLEVNGQVSASAYIGDGSGLTGINSSAVGYSNLITLTSNYTTTANSYNSLYGPLTVGSGVEVTVTAGSFLKIEDF